MPRITPFLWFDSQAEEAAQFYAAIFPNSKVGGVSTYDETVAEVAKRPAGSVMVVPFELDGQKFIALNGGPMFAFTEAVSFVVNVETQKELDYYWDRLLDGGEPQMCGWLKDKFGLSWQVVPAVLERLLSDPDPAKSSRVGAALMGMVKIDIAALEAAYASAG